LGKHLEILKRRKRGRIVLARQSEAKPTLDDGGKFAQIREVRSGRKPTADDGVKFELGKQDREMRMLVMLLQKGAQAGKTRGICGEDLGKVLFKLVRMPKRAPELHL
jgi:hypothetical protein